jgi:hypothetical protein
LPRLFLFLLLCTLLITGPAKAWSPPGCDFNMATPAQVQTQNLTLDAKRALAFTSRGLLAPKTIYGIKANIMKVSCLDYGAPLSEKQLKQDFQAQLEINAKEKGIRDWRTRGLSAFGSGVQNGEKFYLAIFYGPSSQLVIIVVKDKRLFDQMSESVRLKQKQ